MRCPASLLFTPRVARSAGSWPKAMIESRRPRTSVLGTLGPFKKGDHPQKWPRALQEQAFVEKLRKLMIRHTKSQQIHGRAALALPELDAETVWLDMTPLEQRAYTVAKCCDTCPVGHLVQTSDLALGTFGAQSTPFCLPIASPHCTFLLRICRVPVQASADGMKRARTRTARFWGNFRPLVGGSRVTPASLPPHTC